MNDPPAKPISEAESWSILRRAGLPLGSPEAGGDAPAADVIAQAVRAVLAADPSGRPRDALSAFVLAWHRQWPMTFARAFGDDATAVVAWADNAIDDPNRYLKLSRIAMAHLALVL